MARFMNKLQVDKDACLSSLEKLQDVEQGLDHLELLKGETQAFICMLRRRLQQKLGSIVEAQENGAK